MQLAFDEKGDVTVVRVQEPKLTYPVLSAFFSEVRQQVEAGARKLVIDLARGQLPRQRVDRLPDGRAPAAPGEGRRAAARRACSRASRR